MASHSEKKRSSISRGKCFSDIFSLLCSVGWFILYNVLEAFKEELFALVFNIKHSPDFSVLFQWLYRSYIIWKARDPC